MRRRFRKILVVAAILTLPGLGASFRLVHALTATPSAPANNASLQALGQSLVKSKAPVVIPAKPFDLLGQPSHNTPTVQPDQSSSTKVAAPSALALTTSSDTTSPVGPTQVTASTQSIFTISANWSGASDGESGISYYVYGIGTTSSGTYSTLANTRWWQVTYGTSMSANLTLDPSLTYYVSVYAVNGAGLSGSILTSSGIQPVWQALGQSTNQVSIAFAPTGYDASGNVTTGFTDSQIATMTAFYNKMYPILRQMYGPPATNYTVTLVRDLRYTNSNEFIPSLEQIRMSDGFYPQLFTHEFVHAFRNTFILSSDQNWQYDATLSGFEEGFAQAVSYEVMNQYVQTYPNDAIVPGNSLWGSSMDWDYDYQNAPEIRGTNFWSDGGGTLLYWTRYEMAAAAIRKINIESPGFYAAFNQAYYNQINANPMTIHPTQALITSIIQSLVPQIEGAPAATWLSQQNIFYDQNVYGEKIFHWVQDYPATTDYFAFQRSYFLNTMSCGSEWTCWNGTNWVYYNLNGSNGTGTLTDDNGNTVWTGSMQIEPTTNPSDGTFQIGWATKNLTTASTLLPWPADNTSDYVMNLNTLGLYKFSTSFTDPNTGTSTSNSIYRVFGSQLTNAFKGVWGGIIGHKNGTIYLDHAGYPTEPGIPVTNGAFAGTRAWAGVADSRTGGYDSVPGKVSVTFVDSDTGLTYQAQRDIDYGSSNGNQMFLFNFGAPIVKDTTAPTVSVTSPIAGASLSTSTNLTASASDNVGVTRVEFYVDAKLAGTVTARPYALSWNPGSVSLGSHSVTARAYDLAGNNTTSAAVSFKVTDTTPPTASIHSPANGGTVSRNTKISITAAAVDNRAITKVVFYVNNSQICSDTKTPYSCSWSVPAKSGVKYTILVKAYDSSGNSVSTSITVTSK